MYGFGYEGMVRRVGLKGRLGGSVRKVDQENLLGERIKVC